MKALFASLALVPALVLAQASPAPAKAKPAHAAKKASHPKPAEETVEADPKITLTEAELAAAKQVYVGEMPCELGAKVTVKPLKREGFFLVATKQYRFAMHPVESRTGAIRLEDPQRGAMWLQLGNKSMLMSQKLGQRLADECQSPEQVLFAEKLKANPQPSILDSTPGPQSTTTLKQPGS
jgi:hypothetical protein